MVTSIDSGVVVRRFFERSHDCLSGLSEKHISLASSLSSLQENYKNPDKVTSLKRRLWGSEKEVQKQEELLLAVKGLLYSSIRILEQLLAFDVQIENSIAKKGGEGWLTPQIEQDIYAYLLSLRFLFNTEVQVGLEEQEQPIPEGLLEIHADLYPDGLLKKAEKLHIELSVQPSFISEHLSEFHKALAGLASTVSAVWSLSIQAGLLVVSSPFVAAGVPLLICISLALIGAGAQLANMRHAVKMGIKPALDKEVIINFIKSLNDMASFLNALFSIKQDTTQIPQIRKDLQVGVEAIQEIKAKIDNQQPAITNVNNNYITLDGSGIAALANLPADHPLVLAFSQQTAPLQIAGAPSESNEVSYVPRQRKISALSAISEESSSASTSRSSTPPTDYSDTGTPPSSRKALSPLDPFPSSSKGKPLMVEIESEEEYLAFQEFRKQRQIEMKANLKAA